MPLFFFFIRSLFPLVEKNVCTSEEFTCKDTEGECIPMAWVCDQNEDCSDKSDEAACSKCEARVAISHMTSMDFELISFYGFSQMRRVARTNLLVPMENAFSSAGVAIETMIAATAATN